MGLCMSSKKDDDPLILDVQQTIADAAWELYYYGGSRWERMCMRRKNYTIDVPMNFYHFEVTDEKLEWIKPDKNKNDDSNGNNGGDKTQSAHKMKTSPEHVGLETEFKNSTGEKQTYNFKCEKTRKSTMSVTFQKGFTIGGKANFSLGLPKIASDGKVSAETDMRVTVTKTTGETFEQTLTTCATSDITVAPHSHYTATVDMKEYNILADFKVRVKMSMPAKEARATIKNKHGDPVFFYKLRNLYGIFPEETHLKDEKGDIISDAIEFMVEGRVDGVQMSSHCINLMDHTAADARGQVQPQDGGQQE